MNKVKISSRGGFRKNSGRKKGDTVKLSAQSLLNQLEMDLKRPYAEQLVSNYMKCLNENDKSMVHAYDKLFLSKVVADKVEVDLNTPEELLELKRQAFNATIAALGRQDEE